MTRPVALSIAGSDSGGGAGIQADLRTFSRLGTFGTTAITAITAQNLGGVTDVHGVPVATVQAQIAAVFEGFSVQAVKTGMLWSAEIVRAVAGARRAGPFAYWVVDPVMVATSGSRLLREDAVAAYREELIPGATLVTPNLDEAAVLLGVSRIGRDEMQSTACELVTRLGAAVLLKGGHLDGDPVDVLAVGPNPNQDVTCWSRPRITGVNTHGTGCMLSAAIAAHLARGFSLRDSCEGGLGFVAGALSKPWLISQSTRLAAIEVAEGRPAGLV
jgi:hydroxymethylpyrimidine/phosphomethylpyrimidine kinase